MPKAKPRTIRLDDDVDKALDAYVEELRLADPKANYNGVVNGFCRDRLIDGKLGIEQRLQKVEQKVSDIEARLDAD